MAWMSMMGAGAVEYLEENVVERGDDHPQLTLSYYDERGEAPMRWGGNGAVDLGLDGVVDIEHYRALFGPGGARDPRTLERLVATRRPGMQLVIAAHKSVAELGVIGHVGDMHKIMDAERDATLHWLDAVTGERGGRRGRSRQPTATDGLIYAHTRHATSRAGDPSPHDHVLVANLVRMADAEGGWKAADTTVWREELHAATVVGRLAAARVAVEAGYAIELDAGKSGRLGHWRVKGVPDQVLDLHSKRSAQIDEAVGKFGFASPRARGIAARATRVIKRHTPVAELMTVWQGEVAEIGWPVARLDRSVAGAALGWQPPGRLSADELVSLVAEALSIDSPLSRRKVFTISDIVVAVGPQLYGRPTDQLQRTLEAVLASPECVPLTGIIGARERHWTTASVLATEVAIAQLVDEGMSRRGYAVVRHEVITDALSRTPIGLTDGQRRAVEAVSGDGRGITVVLGMAGTGKTTAVATAADALHAAGYRVIGTATSGQAARTLGTGAGIASHTVASLRWQLEHEELRLDRGTAIVMDEAGMTDDPDLLWVLAAARRAGAKVVLIGDDRQLGPVGPGGGFGAVLVRHRRHVVTLDENLRQADPDEGAALAELRHGKVTRAVDWYVANGRVRTHADAVSAIEAIVDGWLSDTLAGHDTALYAWRRSTIDTLNAQARHRWDEVGRLIGPEVEAPGGRVYRAGDQVLALAPAPGRLVTSERATVADVDHRSGAMRLTVSDGSQVTLSREETSSDRLDHGYAVTVHRAQGATVDRAHYVEDGGGRELTYVALSRARDHTTIHTVADDLDQAREDLTSSWSTSRQPQWAIDQGTPEVDSNLAEVAVEAGRAHHHARLAIDPDESRRDLSRQLTQAGEERADLLAGRGRWTDTQAGKAARAFHDAQRAAADAYQRVHEPDVSRRERRSRQHELDTRTAAVADARREYRLVVEPELADVTETVDGLREQLDQLRMDARHDQLQQRLAHQAVGRAVADSAGLSLW